MALALSACSLLPAKPEGIPREQHVLAVTADYQLLRFNAGQPQRILLRHPLSGLLAGDTLRGIDFRVAKGQLFGLGASGQIHRIDPDTGVCTAMGVPIGIGLTGDEIGFDFNPTVDHIRAVTNRSQNKRLHPDTGAVIDANFGSLVMQGSKEGTQPVVSPNTGVLRTVGSLDTTPFKRASFDIDDTTNTAYAALSGADGRQPRWVEINLDTGRALPLGIIGNGQAVRGIAIEP